MLSESAAPAVICAVVTTATCPWLAEITPVTSAGGLDGVVVEELPHASLMVITQPASNASAASSVKLRRVNSRDSSTGRLRLDIRPPVETCRGLTEARWLPSGIRNGACAPASRTDVYTWKSPRSAQHSSSRPTGELRRSKPAPIICKCDPSKRRDRPHSWPRSRAGGCSRVSERTRSLCSCPSNTRVARTC